MRPSDALNQNRELIRELAHRYRAVNPRVFGSTAAGCDREGSDLDLLVDTLPGATLLDLGGLQEELEARLGLPVDLRTPGDLPDTVLAKVLADAEPV